MALVVLVFLSIIKNELIGSDDYMNEDNKTYSSLKPINLKCEHCINPLGINNTEPAFGWTLKSNKRNSNQTAYRLIVASDVNKLKNNNGDIIDTGKIISNKQLINCKIKLSSMNKYWWKLRIWDSNDEPSVWSNIAFFVTGFFNINEWPGMWFAVSSNQVKFARIEFNIDSDKEIKWAVAYVSALGDKVNSFQIRINGNKIGKDVLTPGATESYRALYRTYNIKKILQQKNAVGLIYDKNSSVTLKIQYIDGSTQVVASDESWKITSNVPFVKLGYKGFNKGKVEEYDARLELTNWDKVGFDDSSWNIYRKRDKWGKTWAPLILSAQLVECKIFDTYKPVSIIKLENGKYVVDFGRNMSGFIKINVKGPEGKEILIRYAEEVNSKNEIDQTSYMGQDHYNKYILTGEELETYKPTFMYTGFRYVEITGYPGKLTYDDVQALFIYSDIEDNTYFNCSDKMINKLQKTAKNSFRSNLVNIPTDCPGRERRGWSADAFVVSEAESINFDVLNLYYKWFDDMKDCQKDCGWIPVEYPLSTVEHSEVIWPAASVLIPWDIYMEYGDKNFLKKYYINMKRFVDFLSSISDNNCMFVEGNTAFGDWFAESKASRSYLGMLYYFRCSSLLSNIAQILGKKDDGIKYKKLSKDIRKRINEIFLQHETGKIYYDNNSQSANAHALYFNVVPEKYKGKVLNSLIEKIKEKSRNTTGFLGTMCILPALAESGYNDIAYSLVKNTKQGGWVYMVEECDATTFTEMYDGSLSQNHAFLGGSLSSWFFKQLVGISSLKAGYKKIKIKPYIVEDLEFAEAKIDTRRGLVETKWVKDKKDLYVKVVIPPNCSAEVFIPWGEGIKRCKDNCEVTLGKSDIEYFNFDKNHATYGINSGEYSFKMKFKD